MPARVRIDLRRAADATIRDVIGPGLDVLFCGINPGLYSAATGHHFARPGNRFWPALCASGFTPRLLQGSDDRSLLTFRCGITNLVRRASAGEADLTPVELRRGRRGLERKVRRHRPLIVAVVGIGAYRLAFNRPHARFGRQSEPIAGAILWVLPNTSGLNANHQAADFKHDFRALRLAALAVRRSQSRSRPRATGAKSTRGFAAPRAIGKY